MYVFRRPFPSCATWFLVLVKLLLVWFQWDPGVGCNGYRRERQRPAVSKGSVLLRFDYRYLCPFDYYTYDCLKRQTITPSLNWFPIVAIFVDSNGATQVKVNLFLRSISKIDDYKMVSCQLNVWRDTDTFRCDQHTHTNDTLLIEYWFEFFGFGHTQAITI